MKIRLHIERLILDGVDVTAAQRRVLQATVEAELARLLATRGLSAELTAGGAQPSVIADRIGLGSDATRLGSHIARSVHGGLSA